jgi:hypothetical protein
MGKIYNIMLFSSFLLGLVRETNFVRVSCVQGPYVKSKL